MDDPTAHRLYSLVGRRLRQARRKRKISQETVASELRVKRSSVANFEHGRQRFPVHSIYGFAELVGLDVADVFPSFGELVGEAHAEKTEVKVGDDSFAVSPASADFIRKVVLAEKMQP